MDEDQRKYFEFIQNAIIRMNSNSFSIKEWAVTISSATIGISISTSKFEFLLIGVFSSVIFWFLDSFYLQMEKKYRDLYKDAIEGKIIIPYDMDASRYLKGFSKYLCVVFSKTICPLYFSIILVLMVSYIFYIIK